MKRLACTTCLAAVLIGCNGQEFDLTNFVDLTGTSGVVGINSRSPAGAYIPEFGESVTVQIISESGTDADVTVEYIILDVQVRRTVLHLSPFEQAHPVGPDLAAIVRIDGTYATGVPTPSAVLILGTHFEGGDVIVYVIPDPNDTCLDDPDKLLPGICGCGVPDTDTDEDGTMDCVDLCPVDPGKINPGACGCGEPDTDSDGDRTADCIDGCPNDPHKTAPGVCGCGTADTDSDGDGQIDCGQRENEEEEDGGGGGGGGGDVLPPDCNLNGIHDGIDIAKGTSQDCNRNGVPDECDVASGVSGDANLTGIPDECEGAVGWWSVRSHGGLGDLGIALDRAATVADAATVELRTGGIQRIQVDFSYPVDLLPGATVEAVDASIGTAYVANSVSLVNGGMTLEIVFDPGLLPDEACYVIDLAGAIEELNPPGLALVGDTDCMVCSLAGDVSGDGVVTVDDMDDVRDHRGEPITPENCVYDVNFDGIIDNSDLIAIRVRVGNRI